MGLLDFIKDVAKTTIDTVSLPLDIVKDVVTLGEAGATEEKLEKLQDDLEDVIDDITD